MQQPSKKHTLKQYHHWDVLIGECIYRWPCDAAYGSITLGVNRWSNKQLRGIFFSFYSQCVLPTMHALSVICHSVGYNHFIWFRTMLPSKQTEIRNMLPNGFCCGINLYCWGRKMSSVGAGGTWDSTLTSVNLNHITVIHNLSSPKAKLKWKRKIAFFTFSPHHHHHHDVFILLGSAVRRISNLLYM